MYDELLLAYWVGSRIMGHLFLGYTWVVWYLDGGNDAARGCVLRYVSWLMAVFWNIPVVGEIGFLGLLVLERFALRWYR